MPREFRFYHPFFVLAFFCLFFFGSNTFAQGVSVSAKLDSALIVIGGQIDFKLEVSQPKDVKVSFPLMVDTIVTHIEIVKIGKVDTLSQVNNTLVLSQTYRITSFDSGFYYIPPMAFEVAKGNLKELVKTSGLSLSVVNPFAEVDPEKGLADIKMPLDTPFVFAELYKYIKYLLLFIVLAVAVTFLILYLLKRKTPLQLITKEKPKEPIHILALRRLEHIKQEKLWQKGQIKEFHSEVTETLRTYIEGRYQISALEQTTAEIMNSFKGVEFENSKLRSDLFQILSTADLVKFAKMEPTYEENELSLANAYFFVDQTKIEEVKIVEDAKGSEQDVVIGE